MSLDTSSRQISEEKDAKMLPSLDDGTGDAILTRTLLEWGIEDAFGVNGGGAIHLHKYRKPHRGLADANNGTPKLVTLPEHLSGFAPIGSYLATGKIAVASATTGGAGYKQCEGMLDAKLHSIPAVYQFANSKASTRWKGPLQDMSPEGGNIVGVVRSILGKNCLVLDNIDGLEELLWQAQEILQQPNPVAIIYNPEQLSSKPQREFGVPWIESKRQFNENHVRRFLSQFPKDIEGKRVVVYVGEEATRYEGIQDLITRFSQLLKAPVVYSLNSFNAVSPDNPYAAGFIHLGFNDWTMKLWSSLDKKSDVVVCLGYDPGEYEMNQTNINACVWHFTNYSRPYGSRNNSFSHRVDGKYKKVEGDMAFTLREVLTYLKDRIGERPYIAIPENLNTREIEKPGPDYVDLAEFFHKFLNHTVPGTVVFTDVCQAYKDFQRVLQRPHKDFQMWSANRGSVMGYTLGLATGAKLANPELDVHFMTGDGCFAYMAGALPYAANLGLTGWVLNNGMYHIVGEGLKVVMSKVDYSRFHSVLPPVNFADVGRENQWEAHVLRPDFSNLPEITGHRRPTVSRLIEIPVDGSILIGENPRLYGLRHGETFL